MCKTPRARGGSNGTPSEKRKVHPVITRSRTGAQCRNPRLGPVKTLERSVQMHKLKQETEAEKTNNKNKYPVP